MAKPFQLEILTPERAFYRGECISVIVPVSDGMLGIMANHTPMTAAITDGEVVFTLPDGSKIPCAVTQGMIDVSPPVFGFFVTPLCILMKSMQRLNVSKLKPPH